VSEEFCQKWQLPHCVGALDGKHIAVQAPPNSGSLYYNYKHFFSTVLLALVDASYKFLYVDVGSYGRSADGGIFSNSSLAHALTSNSLFIPSVEPIGDIQNMPYVIVGDDAFPLKPYLMKPYAMRGLSTEQRIFNYRLSRARRVVENAFGILSSRFQIFKKAMALSPERVEIITMAACCLHNFLIRDQTSSTAYAADLIDRSDDGCAAPESAGSMTDLKKQGGNRPSNSACEIRDKFCSYFNREKGAVSWQAQYCFNS